MRGFPYAFSHKDRTRGAVRRTRRDVMRVVQQNGYLTWRGIAQADPARWHQVHRHGRCGDDATRAMGQQVGIAHGEIRYEWFDRQAGDTKVHGTVRWTDWRR